MFDRKPLLISHSFGIRFYTTKLASTRAVRSVGQRELAAKDVGLKGFAEKRSPRLRLQIDTYDFDSIRRWRA
jgi:hypothetical protein